MYCKGEIEKIAARNETRMGIHAKDCKMKAIETDVEGFTMEDNVNHFRTFRESIKTCFWSLFDPGHPEVIGCTQVTSDIFICLFHLLSFRGLHGFLDSHSGYSTRLQMLLSS